MFLRPEIKRKISSKSSEDRDVEDESGREHSNYSVQRREEVCCGPDHFDNFCVFQERLSDTLQKSVPGWRATVWFLPALKFYIKKYYDYISMLYVYGLVSLCFFSGAVCGIAMVTFRC